MKRFFYYLFLSLSLVVNAQHKGAQVMSMMKGINLSQYMDLANLHSRDNSQFTLSGSQISAWNDGISSWTQGTALNRPLLTSGIPIFDGSNDQLIRSAELSRTEFSLYMVFRDTGPISRILLSAQSASDYVMHNAPAGAYDGIGLFTGGVSRLAAVAGIKGNRYSILSIRRNANTFVLRLNDRELIQRSNTFSGQATLIARLMGFTSGGFNMAGGVRSLCISSTYLSDAVDLQVRNKLYSDYNLAAETAAEYVVGFGDSNTVGFNVTSYLRSLATSLGVADCNLGITGTRFTTFNAQSGITRYPTQLVSRPYTDYVVIQYGTNDILASVSATTFGTQLNSMVADLIAKGYNPNRICLVSNPYQRAGANATALNDYRTQIQNVATIYGTKYYDFLEWMRNNGADSLLLTGDPVHLTQAAHNSLSSALFALF